MRRVKFDCGWTATELRDARLDANDHADTKADVCPDTHLHAKLLRQLRKLVELSLGHVFHGVANVRVVKIVEV